jgi:hypothetical protein
MFTPTLSVAGAFPATPVTVIGDSIVVLSLIAKSVSLVNTRGLGLAVGEIVGEIVGEGDGDPVPVLAVTTSA